MFLVRIERIWWLMKLKMQMMISIVRMQLVQFFDGVWGFFMNIFGIVWMCLMIVSDGFFLGKEVEFVIQKQDLDVWIDFVDVVVLGDLFLLLFLLFVYCWSEYCIFVYCCVLMGEGGDQLQVFFVKEVLDFDFFVDFVDWQCVVFLVYCVL